MEVINTTFFFITDLIVTIMAFFIAQAWNIGSFVLIISICTAVINYAITGQGLKENAVKIAKAVVFFILIMGIYPRLMGFITEQSFRWARDSVYVHMSQHLQEAREDLAEAAAQLPERGRRRTAIQDLLNSPGMSEPMSFFSSMIQRREVVLERQNNEREARTITYTVIAPAAALEVVMLLSSIGFNHARMASWSDFNNALIGNLIGFLVMAVGIFAVIEYLMAFLEFMLVAGVGVILFPLSLWEGSKFLAEKLIGAIIGFFLKLLFCNITMFLMMFGYLALLREFATTPFLALPDQLIQIGFSSLLFFYLCKSGPGLAQSLLSGVPSLSAAGAAGAAGSALLAAKKTAGMAMSGAKTLGNAGGAVAGGAAKTIFGAAGMLSQAFGSQQGAKEAGGTKAQQAGAFFSSIGNSAATAMKASGGNLARSLLGGGAGGGGGGGGTNRNDNLQGHLARRDANGNRESVKDYMADRKAGGKDYGKMHVQKDKMNKANEKAYDDREKTRRMDNLKAYNCAKAQNK
ncbi:MAG: type IV secretion system protein [Treponema sp.]|nr:type IV secretion system protein [Treponema sp.]